ncbi:hypothetical protein Lser_V15G28162 [Lactuca serriola]
MEAPYLTTILVVENLSTNHLSKKTLAAAAATLPPLKPPQKYGNRWLEKRQQITIALHNNLSHSLLHLPQYPIQFLHVFFFKNLFNLSLSGATTAAAIHQPLIKKDETVEERLARARFAILEAGRMKRYKMPWRFNDRSFTPRGSVYRNPYAFHQLRLMFFTFIS